MHYYQFNIGDYHAHTNHLEPMEDLAYRRMIDYCYLNEIPLPDDIDEIARLIRMRSHTDCIAVVLREFFTRIDGGYIQQRIDADLDKYREKSEKAKKSAEARWKKKPSKDKGLADANALRPECEGNANQEPITKNHKPITKENRASRFAPPTQQEAGNYFLEKGSPDAMNEADKFIDFYESKGWMVGKNKMKCWKAAIRNWLKRSNQANQPVNQDTTNLLTDRSWADGIVSQDISLKEI